VKQHTQLEGAVIASTADKDKNTLDTGTLGWSDIHNQADFSAEHSGGSFSSGGPVGSDLLTNLAGSALSGANNSGHASGSTQSAVSEGNLVIRDQDNQQQDVAELNRDTDHANDGSINPIFDKEKEQNRLKEAQLIGEIGMQAMDIVRTQGDLNGLSEAKKAHPDMSVEQLRQTDVYKAEMQKYGTGSALQQGMQAATAAIQGLAGGDIAKALAGGSAPYLAEQIHEMTTDASGKVNTEANLMAHAVVGAVIAQINGNGALAGASGAVAGEYIAQQLYPGVNREDLTEEQRQSVSALGTLAAGLAGGLAGDSAADAVAGAQAGKNAVENNYLSQKQKTQREEEFEACKDSTACKLQVGSKWDAIDIGQQISYGAGMLIGVPAGFVDSVQSIVNMGLSPVETYDALKSLFNSGDVLGNVSDAVKQSYITRLNNMEAEYQKAGASGSFNAGVEGGKLISEIASLAAGGAGVAKGGAVLVEKVAAKVVGKAESAAAIAGKTTSTNIIKNTAETQASVDKKLTTYLLEKEHPVGGSKAEWFDSALGFNKANSNELAKQIVFDPAKAVKTAETQFGVKYDQVVPITGANGRTIDVKFGWIKNNDGVVRLVTAIPTKK